MKTIKKIDLVLVPGFGFHTDVFENLMPLLSEDFHVTALNLPGFENSARFPQIPSMYSLIQSLLEQAPPKAFWFGWSLGGTLLFWLAQYFPERLNGFITVGATPKFLATENWPGMSLSHFQTFQTHITMNPQQALLNFLLLQGKSKKDPMTTPFLKSCLQQHSLPPIAILNFYLEVLAQTDLRQELSRLSVPSLCFFAEQDQLVPVEVAAALHRLAPKLTINFLANQGHASFLCQPSAVINPLRHFCTC